MLPSRSKRYAVADGEVPRLVLANVWQLVLIAMLVSTLLVIIFPHKTLVETLYQQEKLDPLTLSYIQNLYRAETANVDIALLLARSQIDARNIREQESILLDLTTSGTTRQRHEATMILFESYNKELVEQLDQTEVAKYTLRLIHLLRLASKEDWSESVAREFATKSFELNLPVLGLEFFKRLQWAQPDRELEKLGDMALERGQHGVAAAYFLFAREHAGSITEARRLFQKGIQTYMAGSLFKSAMQAAAQYLGELESDLPTLRFMSRTALAAGNLEMAADFARKLVFTSNDGVSKP